MNDSVPSKCDENSCDETTIHLFPDHLRLALQINGGRQLSGILRGYDPFMNLVIDEAVEKKKTGDQQSVSRAGVNLPLFTFDATQHHKAPFPLLPSPTHSQIGMVVIRGNSIIMLEALDRI